MYRIAALVLSGALFAAVAPASAQTTIIEIPGAPGILSADDARDIALDHGIRRFDKIELDRGAREWEIDGRDLEGRYVEMDIDANTGAVLRLDR